jgi:hypothetical protein
MASRTLLQIRFVDGLSVSPQSSRQQQMYPASPCRAFRLSIRGRRWFRCGRPAYQGGLQHGARQPNCPLLLFSELELQRMHLLHFFYCQTPMIQLGCCSSLWVLWSSRSHVIRVDLKGPLEPARGVQYRRVIGPVAPAARPRQWADATDGEQHRGSVTSCLPLRGISGSLGSRMCKCAAMKARSVGMWRSVPCSGSGEWLQLQLSTSRGPGVGSIQGRPARSTRKKP